MSLFYKNILIYLFSLAVIIGPAYNTYSYCDYKENPDCLTYMSIANSNFHHQSPIRRYRILVPYMAKAVSLPFEKIMTSIWKGKQGSDWPLRLGFLIVNILLMCGVGLTVYHCCKAYNISETGSLLAVLATLVGGRYGNYIAALPLTDSLYMLVLSLVLYAVKTRQHLLLSFCILIGPLAKESFVFILPFIFFFSAIPKYKQVFLFAASACMVLTMRYLIDAHIQASMGDSVNSDVHHFNNITISLQRIFALTGIRELFTVLGVFSLLLLVGLWGGKKAVQSWTIHTDAFLWCFAIVMFIHALLSVEVSRMLYLGSAAWAVMIGLIWDWHPAVQGIKMKFNAISD